MGGLRHRGLRHVVLCFFGKICLETAGLVFKYLFDICYYFNCGLNKSYILVCNVLCSITVLLFNGGLSRSDTRQYTSWYGQVSSNSMCCINEKFCYTYLITNVLFRYADHRDSWAVSIVENLQFRAGQSYSHVIS